MGLKFGQIQPSSAELAAIERLKKKSPHTYNGKNCVATFSQQLPFLIRPVSYLQVVMTHISWMTLKIGKIQPQSTKLSALRRLKIDVATISWLLLIWSVLNLYALRTCMISIYEGQLK